MQLSSGRYLKSLYGILVMGLCIAGVSARTLPLKVEYLSSHQGLRENRVQDICEDVNGFLLVAAEVIHNYDSEILTIFDYPDFYYCIAVDIDGNIIATSWDDIYVFSVPSKDHYATKIIPEADGRCPFVTDDHKNLWVGTPVGKLYQYRYDKDSIEFIRELILRDDSKTLGSVNVISLKDSNNIWIGCENGLFICSTNENSDMYPCYLKSGNEYRNFPAVHSIYHDADGEFWLGTSEGLKLISPEVSNDSYEVLLIADIIYKKYPSLGRFDKEIVFAIQADERGELYWRTEKAIYATNKNRSQIQLLHEEDIASYDEYYGYSQYALQYMKGGLLWFGTNRGVGKINLNNRAFEIYQHDPRNPASLSDNNLNQVVMDHNGNLWVGTTGKGLNKGIPDKDGNGYWFERYLNNPNDPYSLHSNTISHLFVDSKGIIWVGAGSIQRIDESTGKVRFIYPDCMNDFPDKNTPSRVISIMEDTAGNFWFGFIGSSIIFNPANRKWSWFYIDEEKTETEYLRLFLTNDQNHYVLSYPNGLYKIEFPLKQIGNNAICPSSSQLILDNKHFEGLQDINSILTETEDYKEIWTAFLRHYRFTETKGGAINIELIHEYTMHNDGKPWEYASSLIKDDRNNIWAAAQNGLSCIDPVNKILQTIYKEDGLPANSFYYGNFKDSNGRLYFTSSEGLVVLQPEDIEFHAAPNVFLKRLTINRKLKHRKAKNSEKNTNLSQIIEFPSDDIVLSYYQNSFSVDYVAPDFVNFSLVKYKWTLREYRQNLELTGYDRRAVFVNLRPGHYDLNVTAANHNNVWNMTGADLKIIILPPPWQTWYAYIVYGLILLGIILIYRRFLLRRAKLKTALEIERVEKDKVLEIDHMKSRFFANISHEFRTPLTLLLGPVEDLLKSKSGRDEKERGIFKMMQRNIKRLHTLINQLLDLSKLETGKIKLQVSEGNLSEFIRRIVLSFLSLAESRNIDYQYDIPDLSDPVYYDADKVEKILTNLISNAFKFTAANGKVNVNLKYVSSVEAGIPEFADLCVSDTGKGIPEEKLNKIFDRFYQVSDSDTRDTEGSGVGLALTKELVDLYRGEISVESDPDGYRGKKGSTFRVRLPVSREQFKEEEIVAMIHDEDVSKPEEVPEEPELTEMKENHYKEKAEGVPVILIVEDNIDLRNYISGNLGNSYQIIIAENGKQGLELAIESIPDLVVSDLMMPVMDGIEMCKHLKTDARTNHIPVVMLTARADRESKIEGLETGADDYLVKPFDSEELQIRIKNLIEQRNRLREKFRKEFFAPDKIEISIKQNDQLIKRLFELFEENYSDFDFSIEDMSRKLNMSRTQFFRKINAFIDESPNELLRMYRMKKAAALIQSGENNITGIMYEVGFRSTSHFAASFKKYFGQNPSEYRDNINRS